MLVKVQIAYRCVVFDGRFNICLNNDLIVAEIQVIITLHVKILSSNVFQLPGNIDDSEITRLASLFTKHSLKKLAQQYWEFSFAGLENLEDDCIGDSERFNTRLLFRIKCKADNREVRNSTQTSGLGIHVFLY